MVAILRTQVVERRPASVVDRFTGNCKQALGHFKSKYAYSRTKYTKYYAKYVDSNFNFKQDKFESLEDYLAWLDVAFLDKDISLGDYFAKSNTIKAFYEKFAINSTRSDHIGRFFFNGALEDYIAKAVKIPEFDVEDKKLLKRLLSQKIASEAMERIQSGNESRLRTYFRYGMELLMYSPLAVGMPPLKLPGFKLANEKRLIKASSLDEFKEIYIEISEEDYGLLKTKVSYDIMRKYYVMSVSSFYLYYTYKELEGLDGREDMLMSVNETLDLTIKDLKEMSHPSCESVYSCLEDYRAEWENQDEELYLEYKSICHEVYEVDEDC